MNSLLQSLISPENISDIIYQLSQRWFNQTSLTFHEPSKNEAEQIADQILDLIQNTSMSSHSKQTLLQCFKILRPDLPITDALPSSLKKSVIFTAGLCFKIVAFNDRPQELIDQNIALPWGRTIIFYNSDSNDYISPCPIEGDDNHDQIVRWYDLDDINHFPSTVQSLQSLIIPLSLQETKEFIEQLHKAKDPTHIYKHCLRQIILNELIDLIP